MAITPKLLVADEPVTALDADLRAEMLELLQRLSHESGTAMLVVSHELQVLEDLCPRICVLDGGQIVEQLQAGRLDEASGEAARQIIDAHRALGSPGTLDSLGKAAV
jgi:peptide/nickel transport system permease protein